MSRLKILVSSNRLMDLPPPHGEWLRISWTWQGRGWLRILRSLRLCSAPDSARIGSIIKFGSSSLVCIAEVAESFVREVERIVANSVHRLRPGVRWHEPGVGKRLKFR